MNDPLFLRRTKAAYYNNRPKARGFVLAQDYDLPTFRRLVATTIGKPCPYCKTPITVATFSPDHAIPLTRGGTFTFLNLVICCQKCNQAKGPLTADEFVNLMILISAWHPTASKNLIARLRTGNRMHRN